MSVVETEATGFTQLKDGRDEEVTVTVTVDDAPLEIEGDHEVRFARTAMGDLVFHSHVLPKAMEFFSTPTTYAVLREVVGVAVADLRERGYDVDKLDEVVPDADRQ